MYRGWTIPKYDYECTDGHVFEFVAGYDDDEIICMVCNITPRVAKRRAVYQSQSVIFKGDGFTKSVIAPPPPNPKSTQGLTSDEAVEVWDDIAKETYKYDNNDRPYLYEEEQKFVAREGLSVDQAAEAGAEGKALPKEVKERAKKARRKYREHRGGT